MATPMQEQYNKLKTKYNDSVLLFRLGDFYEAFYDDAKILSEVLGITLTGRGKDDNRIPMAGIPFHALNNYLPKLIKSGHKVAIAEQMSEVEPGKLVERQVTEIATPGTYTDERNLKTESNHFISCISPFELKKKRIFHTAYLDLSTGLYFSDTYKSNSELLNNLNKYSPVEILLPEKEKIESKFLSGFYKEYVFDSDFKLERNIEVLTKHFNVLNLKGFGYENDDYELIPLGVLLRYSKENRKTNLQHISKFFKHKSSDYMNLDFSTISNLELLNNNNFKNVGVSLFQALDNCSTNMGKRLLRLWIIQPLINKIRIQNRLDSVNFLFTHKEVLDSCIKYLKEIQDIERILGKLGTNKINAKDLLGLKESLNFASNIFDTLVELHLPIDLSTIHQLIDKQNYSSIKEIIEKSINPECPSTFDKGGVIKDGFDEEVDTLRNLTRNGELYITELQQRERERTQIPSLKVKFNRVFGYYIEITKSHLDKVPSDYIRKQTIANGERFITQELKEFEEKILNSEEKLLKEELRIFLNIVEIISKDITKLQQIAEAISILDVFCNFASISLDRNYIKPTFVTDQRNINIINGRHPVVELLKKESFISNDLNLNNELNFIVLTGPNMSGKSTYIRQIALILLMAQIGCFVPAKIANLSVVDRIFTRVGASDNLSTGESTFMVEMNETANILNNATKDSLIILDEVGRGTSTYDGVAIAWSIVEYIQSKIGAYTLFATHYHELIKLEEKLSGVKNFHVQVLEDNDQVIFSHNIVKGAMDKSYGIHVAQLAGVPQEVILRANGILKNFEDNRKNVQNEKKKKSNTNSDPEELQISLI